MNRVQRSTLNLAPLLLVITGAAPLRGQDAAAIPVQVTAVFADSVFLDKGWAYGVGEGSAVLIDCGQGRTIRAEVRSASSYSSRCVAISSGEAIQAGMLGSVTSIAPGRPPPPPGVPSRWSSAAPGQANLAVAAVSSPAGRDGPGAIDRVEVRVTASSGGSIYLDKGRASGLRPGDEVALFPPGDGIVNATVQSVSRDSARCTVLSGSGRVVVDTRGEVLLPASRNPPPVDDALAPPRDVPQHPPWTRSPEGWDRSQPLLAPAYSRAPDERQREIHGRLFAQYLHTWNQSYADNQYSLGRTGASLWVENPFRRGGRMRIQGELYRRGVFLLDDGNNVAGPGRLDRFSYYWGGTDDRPLRLELGRYLSREFPEFGVVDGVELIYRTASGHRIGGSVGFLPEPFPNLVFRNDLHVAAFCRFVAGADESLSSAVGFQKTWRHGIPDRDLLVWSGDYDPNEHFSVHATMWGDFYDSRDTLKSTSFEITQAILQPMVRIDPGHGFGAHVSHVRWPQLFRRDFSPFVEQQIVRDRVFRYGIFTWQDLGDRVRLNGRVDQWNDQSQETGTSWEGRVAFREVLFENGEVAVTVFGTHGVYSFGPGGRLTASRRLPWCFVSLSYDIADYQLAAGAGGYAGGTPSGLLQQSAHANLDFTISSHRSVSVFTDYRFGHSQEAVQAGMFFQQRL